MAARPTITFSSEVGNDTLELHGAEQSVRIGEYEFTAHYAYVRGSRPTICFTSKKAGDEVSQLFFAYKSSSEGFWRLLMGEHQYHKGLDYITSSFLAIELQILFNGIFSTDPPSLPTFPDDLEHTFFTYVMPTVMREFMEKNTGVTGERIVDEPIFSTLAKINTYEHSPVPPQHIYGGPMRRVVDRETFLTKASPLKNYYSLITAPVESNENRARREANEREVGNSGRYSPVYKRVPNNWTYKRPAPSPEEAQIEQYFRDEIAAAGDLTALDTGDSFMVLGRVVSHFFRPAGDGRLQHVFNTTLQYARSQSNLSKGYEKFNMSIYSTQYESTMTGRVYIFYIGFYIFRGEVYKHLVNIIPADATVFPNGCYTQIVHTDVYIYKPLDYHKQCWGVSKQRECSMEYSFIGDIFQDMWPLTEFPPPPEMVDKAAKTNLGISAINAEGRFLPNARPARPRGAGVRGGPAGGARKTYRRGPKVRRNRKSKKQKKRT